ncbi:MAG: trypsin-like peptidase domain-containing protein [Candidatus Aureabacteria bacterium]|nr:trypsin-like peptidase domain-containing protein [Candidatus Auribacterota bacterium]
MKRYVLLLTLMVVCASALIVFISDYQALVKKSKGRRGFAGEAAERSIEDIVEAVGPSVVAINTRERRLVRPRGGDPLLRYFGDDSDLLAESEGIGSGVIFDPDGYVLTNGHVVGRAQEIQVTLADGRRVEATLCAIDQERDLALIKLAEGGLHAAEFGDSENLRVGQWVIAFGNPFGTASRNAQPSVTSGVISALQRNLKVGHGLIYRDLIQTDAAINSGNNGGPLVDLSGRVIGLNTLILTSSGASTGLGFAIPIDSIKERLDELKRQCLKRQGVRGATR